MAQSTESYIAAHQDDVDKWLLDFFGHYIRRNLKGFETVNSDRICSDARRVHKMLEVLRHYNLMSSCQITHTPYRYGYKTTSSYNITMDVKAFKKVAKQYAEPFNFGTKAPLHNADRVSGYPKIAVINSRGLIHYYFNKSRYIVSDRMEFGFDHYGKRDNNETRVIRLYPKKLESKAERGVFLKQVEKYYSSNMDKTIELLYGFTPEVLMTGGREFFSGNDLRNLSPERVNGLALDDIDKDDIRERLSDARKLKEYADASVRDLEKLVTKVPVSHEKIMKSFFKTAEAHLESVAPLLINDEDEKLKALATLIMSGSNKGLL